MQTAPPIPDDGCRAVNAGTDRFPRLSSTAWRSADPATCAAQMPARSRPAPDHATPPYDREAHSTHRRYTPSSAVRSAGTAIDLRLPHALNSSRAAQRRHAAECRGSLCRPRLPRGTPTSCASVACASGSERDPRIRGDRACRPNPPRQMPSPQRRTTALRPCAGDGRDAAPGATDGLPQCRRPLRRPRLQAA